MFQMKINNSTAFTVMHMYLFQTVLKPFFLVLSPFSARLEEPDQMIPFIIAFSSVAAVAVPAAAILIYVSRQAKINGSYSLVKALRLKV